MANIFKLYSISSESRIVLIYIGMWTMQKATNATQCTFRTAEPKLYSVASPLLIDERKKRAFAFGGVGLSKRRRAPAARVKVWLRKRASTVMASDGARKGEKANEGNTLELCIIYNCVEVNNQAWGLSRSGFAKMIYLDWLGSISIELLFKIRKYKWKGCIWRNQQPPKAWTICKNHVRLRYLQLQPIIKIMVSVGGDCVSQCLFALI
jgi:hypothetical protein